MADEGPVTAEEVHDEMVGLLERAGIEPHFVHAVRVCGFIVTEQNRHLFDDEDLGLWEDAIDEWLDLHPDY